MQNGTKNGESVRKPRGRPRAYEPAAALQQATDAFWKTGYAGTSLDDIAAATGMNRPSLRAAFGDKRAIYLKALNAYWELKLATMREALGGELPLDQALMSAYDAALSIYFSGRGRARGCFVVGTAVTEAVHDAETRKVVSDGFRKLDADFAARLRLAQETGELKRCADPEALAMLATATMQTMAIRARSGSSREDLRRFAEKAVGVICA